jgi:hypothetical protein
LILCCCCRSCCCCLAICGEIIHKVVKNALRSRGRRKMETPMFCFSKVWFDTDQCDESSCAHSLNDQQVILK